MQDRKKILEYELITGLSALLFLTVMAVLTGKGLFRLNAYHSYALQADSWRQGRLDLGQDYPWLELAIYEGRYYVSFPPFPSYVLFPLTFLFGSSTPDGVVLWIADILSAVFLYKTAVRGGVAPEGAAAGALSVLLGSNMVFLLVDPSVWFFAQTLCFMTAILSIYFAISGRGALSLFFWACSVGCRPMQIVFVPVLLVLLYQKVKKEHPGETVAEIIRSRVWWGIPAGAVAVSYMLLNYFRFGNIAEFGHKYLPEFVRAEYGQFHVVYIKDNLKALFRMPEFLPDGKMFINSFGNLSMLVIDPIVVIFLLELLYLIIIREKKLAWGLAGILALSALYLLIVVMHRTMGAWHFGNRYANDILPWIFLGTVLVHARHPRLAKYQVPPAVAACALNLVGSVAVYNGWV